MNQERLFLAIGGADPALLERSERKRRAAGLRWGGLAAAACLAVLCTLAVYMSRRPAAPVTPDVPSPPDNVQAAPEILALTGGDIGDLHLVQIPYGAAEQQETADDFILYINEEIYCGTWEDGLYIVRPREPLPEGMPECSLTVSHRRNVLLDTVLEETRELLAEEYDIVQDQSGSGDRIALAAWNGTEYGAEWDAANAAVTLADDRQGGVYVLTARYFTEAAEGHGVNFADMSSSFQPVPPDVAVPKWMTVLRETVDALLPAVFSGQWTSEASALLEEGAWVCGYEEDVSGQVNIAGVDISTDDDRAPASAEVSVRHRVSAEEPYDYVTMELSCTDGQWRASFIGLER